MNLQKSRRQLALTLSLFLLAAPLVAAGFFVYEKHQAAAARLEQLEPRYARLKGLMAQETEIAELLEQTQKAGQQYVYPASQDSAQAGNAAQQRIRELLTAAGLQISSSQVLLSKAEKGLERIPLSVRAEGDFLALESALAVLSTQLPLILIQELDVQPIGGLQQVIAPGISPRLAVQFSFSVLKGQK